MPLGDDTTDEDIQSWFNEREKDFSEASVNQWLQGRFFVLDYMGVLCVGRYSLLHLPVIHTDLTRCLSVQVV